MVLQPTRLERLRSAWADSESWDREYTLLRAIPSSHRLRPSRAFLRLQRDLRLRPGAKVLDAGAGTGRHALYLATLGCAVTAVDGSGAACAVLEARADAARFPRKAVHVQNALLSHASLPDDQFDVVIDSYVSCHILSEEERLQYLGALLKQVRPGGSLYTACMSTNDEYYAPLANGCGVATDPLNGIAKLLQDPTYFASSIATLTPTWHAICEEFTDRVAGLHFQRQVLAAVITRPV